MNSGSCSQISSSWNCPIAQHIQNTKSEHMRSIKIARGIDLSLHTIWPQVMITANFEPNWEIVTMLLRNLQYDQFVAPLVF